MPLLRWLRVVQVFVLATLLLTSIGCGRSSQRPLFPVRGQVMVNGHPAEEALVVLVPLVEDNDQPRSHGFCLADGSFELSTYKPGDGAPAGRYTVSIVWSKTNPNDNRSRGPDLLRGRYAQAEKSGLQVEVKEGKNQLSPFELQVSDLPADRRP
jgi:hypothetical protein